MTSTPPSFAAEYRRRRHGLWQLLTVRESESACWFALLAADLGDADLRVRPLRRRAAPRERGPELFPCPS